MQINTGENIIFHTNISFVMIAQQVVQIVCIIYIHR